MKNNETTEMWKNTFEKINEKYIAEAAEIAPSGEERDLRAAPAKSGTGNLKFALAAAATVIVSFIGVGFFFKGTGIEPLSPASSTTNVSLEEIEPPVTTTSDLRPAITTSIIGEYTEITTAVSPVSEEDYEEWFVEAEKIKEGYLAQIEETEKEIKECEERIAGLEKKLETAESEQSGDYENIKAELAKENINLAHLTFELAEQKKDYNAQVLLIETNRKTYEELYPTVTAAKQSLTMEKLKSLVEEKGKELTWSDLEQFEGTDIGSGLYILKYTIDEVWSLVIGGVPTEKPMYVNLTCCIDGRVFSISDNGSEGFEEFIRHVNEDLNKKLLSLAQLEEISRKYDIPLDMITDFEIKTETDTVYHDTDKYFYPMYLVFEADNRLVINTTAKDTESQYFSGVAACISVVFEKFTGEWERTLDYWYEDPAILKGNLYSQKDMPSEIVIPEGITEIAEGVFMDCAQIEKVTLPSTLKIIGVGAFKDCTNLKEINIPYGVTTIGERAFENCTSVYMVLPDTVTTIGDGAFAGCTQFDGTFKPTPFDPETIDETENFTLIRPVDSTFITADYSAGDKGHDGIDYAGEIGDNIYAAADGIVTTAETGYEVGKGYGKYVIIDHGNGFTTMYAHMDNISVEMFAEVSQGDVIGKMGSTGWSTGPHLHFVLVKDGVPVDPHIYLGDPIQLIQPTGDVYPEDDILYGYGEYEGHKGIDFRVEKGQDVSAAANGTVSFAGWSEGYGNCVIIDHRNGYQTLYGHLDEIKVQAGDSVTTGHLIGTAGSSGVVTGVQLHFELLKDGRNLDPADYIN